MYPELLKLSIGVGFGLAVYFAFLALAVVLALRARAPGTTVGAAFPWALKRAVLATVSAGLAGSDEADGETKGEATGQAAPKPKGPDLSLVGTLATLGGLLPLGLALVNGKTELPVQSYPVAMAVGFVVVIWLCSRRLRALGFDQAHVLDVAIICIVAGPIGSRVFFVAQFWDEYFADRPAVMASGPLVPLEKGQELVAKTQTATATAAFQGDETTWELVEARLAPLEAAGVRVRLVTLERRVVGGAIEHRDRGLALETVARGEGATLRLSGAAAQRLFPIAPPPDGVARGLRVPLSETLALWKGGIVFYGGLIAATACAVLYLVLRRYPLLLFADGIAPVMGIGFAFGRIGCTLNGCCWGREVDGAFPLGIRFPVSSHPWLQHVRSALSPALDPTLDLRIGDLDRGLRIVGEKLPPELVQCSHPVHPVQIYDAFGDLALAGVVYAFSRYFAKREGQTFFLFYICYAISRFTSEHFRGDHGHFTWLLGYPFTVSQLVSVATLPVALGLFAWASRRAPRPGASSGAAAVTAPQTQGVATP